ncbi:Os01g0807133 [Oryza sativa Japonica Group]|uniref:Os01g0807133 protein n=1 Tax=Oryza sativa subsp. japonica TaxID=39947 RepID=A0A0P0V9D0_ORYSJ|nr:Os01g0807133 [Oryza sativa Japonica Group]
MKGATAARCCRHPSFSLPQLLTITTVVLAAAAADPTRADSPASSGVVVWKPPPSPDSADSVDLGEPRNLCRHLEQRRGTGTKSRKAEEAARRRLQSS